MKAVECWASTRLDGRVRIDHLGAGSVAGIATSGSDDCCYRGSRSSMEVRRREMVPDGLARLRTASELLDGRRWWHARPQRHCLVGAPTNVARANDMRSSSMVDWTIERSSLGQLVGSRGRIVAESRDAELTAAAYAAWGDDCVSKLIGDFAFAPLGQRPASTAVRARSARGSLAVRGACETTWSVSRHRSGRFWPGAAETPAFDLEFVADRLAHGVDRADADPAHRIAACRGSSPATA